MSSSLLRYTALAAVLAINSFAIPSHGSSRKGDGTVPTANINKVLAVKAELDSASTLPSTGEPSSGEVQGTYDRSTHVLKFNARFFFLSGPATSARFHGPAAIDTDASAIVAAPRPEARLVTGTAWLDDEQEHDLLEGRWYFNVTTAKHPQGEIRGTVHVKTADQ